MMKYQQLFIAFMFLFNIEGYTQNRKNMEVATFGSGCFWCTEAIFQQLKGVESAISGYSGGNVKNPTYNEVCSGQTGHAEVIQVKFNPEIITYTELLEVFWQTHNPTTLNRQGADVGTQYRSVIFYHSNEQKKLAETLKRKLDEAKIYNDPIVTDITEFDTFYKAEEYHQEYYDNNKAQPYCNFVITPKLDKFKKVFKDKIK
jgi:peptide-methionine (S)-S-oxide reductase